MDGVRKLLVKVPVLKDAKRLEEVFDQDIVIVGLGRLKVSIADGYGASPGLIGINHTGGDQVDKIGSGDALAVVPVNVRIFPEHILDLQAGQNIQIAGVLIDWPNRRVAI